MSIEDYLENFADTTICKMHDDFAYTHIEMSHQFGEHNIVGFKLKRA